MPFQIHILGCGSAAPTLNRRASAQAINVRNNWFLVDCGEGTQLQLRKYKIKFQKINEIFISHLHGDHIFGLIGLLCTYHLLGRTIKLTVFGPKGIEEFLKTQLRLTETYLKYPLTIIETATDKSYKILENNVCEVYTIPLKHRIACTGYLFKEKPALPNVIPHKMNHYKVSMAYARKVKLGEAVQNEDGELISSDLLTEMKKQPRSYAYCSDTAYNPDIIPIIKDVSLLYHEATFLHNMLDRAKFTMHSTAYQAGSIAKQANVKQLVIGHFSARYTNPDVLVDETKKEFNNVLAAEDGLLIKID